MLQVAPVRKDWQAGKVTMCRFCAKPRPERAHHCTVCGVCVMRLDHHCPWINNCVGFNNHKYFLLTCFYTVLACTAGLFSTLPELMSVAAGLRAALHGAQSDIALGTFDELSFLLFGFVAVLIATFVMPLFGIQLQMTIRNRTAVEENYTVSPNPFDRGAVLANLAQIFGTLGPDWLLPIKPLRPVTDGLTFPSRETDPIPLEELSQDDLRMEWADSPTRAGEAFWSAHYKVKSDEEVPRPSVLEYWWGCMQLDCDGNPPPKGAFS